MYRQVWLSILPQRATHSLLGAVTVVQLNKYQALLRSSNEGVTRSTCQLVRGVHALSCSNSVLRTNQRRHRSRCKTSVLPCNLRQKNRRAFDHFTLVVYALQGLSY